MDSNLPANYWRGKLEWTQFQRQKLVKKAAWSAKDAEDMDEINEMIEYYENMLEWCDVRDNDHWSWDQWLSHLANKKKPQVNKIIGTLPNDEF
jgi:hypothetical protein